MKELIKVARQLKRLAAKLDGNGLRLFVVGGAVRDALMGIEPKDIDLMVLGGSLDEISDVISRWHKVHSGVHQHAPVVHVVVDDDLTVDLAAAWDGGTDEDGRPVTGAHVSLEDDLKRRDLTINAMAWDVKGRRLIDVFGGEHDLGLKMMRPVDVELFAQSPERPLRAASLASRRGLLGSHVLVETSRKMVDDIAALPTDQWWNHWCKLMAGDNPSLGVRLFSLLTGGQLLPDWEAVRDVEQDPEWHAEGPVDVHSLMVLKSMVTFTETFDHDSKVVLRLAAWLHDLGKATTTSTNEHGRTVSPGHAEAGVEPARRVLKRIGAPRHIADRVLKLVEHHMRQPETVAGVRRLATALWPATIRDWSFVRMSDILGREGEHEPDMKGVWQVVDMARQLELVASRPEPVLMGRHLIDLGHKPGPQMGELLGEAFDAQLEGAFSDLDGALAWLARR